MSDYEAGRRCDVCGSESPYVPVCGECEIAARADAQQDRQARTIRRLRALADGYRGQRKWLTSVVAKVCVVAAEQERDRIEATLTAAIALGEWAKRCHREHELVERFKSCNLHRDCAAADALAEVKGQRATHCRVEDCEDCFGS